MAIILNTHHFPRGETIILLKLDGVGVFATAPCVSHHADDRAQRVARERAKRATHGSRSEPPPQAVPARAGAACIF